MKFKAILFDMDGVLVLSEPVHYKAWLNVIQEIGVEPIDEREVIGHTDMAIAKEIKLRSKSGLSADELCEMKTKSFLYLSQSGLPPIEGRNEFLSSHYQDTPMAVVSSSTKNEISTILEVNKISNYFRFFIGFEDIALHKPNPDPYLKAMDLLQCSPMETLIIEDSPTGVEAGKRAGAHVIGINSSELLNESNGVLLFQNFNEIKDWLENGKLK